MSTGGRQNVVLLGATGSIGQSTLKVLRLHPERFALYAVAANKQSELLLSICREFRPRFAILTDQAASAELQTWLRAEQLPTEVLRGAQALSEVSALSEVAIVVAAIVGAAGLPATLSAVKAGKRVLLANKEALVVGGALITDAARASGAFLLPVDSEHNALFQCLSPELRGRHSSQVHAKAGLIKLWLTASGGPFLHASEQQLANVTPAQACAHPNWTMGRKISVDSATLMNKGLEVIEAHWLFGLAAKQIEVVIHPQSTVHALVQYCDGSFLAQLSSPDMCTPIAHALSYPDRIAAGVQVLDPLTMGPLQFSAPDRQRFPCLKLAYDALSVGGAAAIVLNAANEVAVESFLNLYLPFVRIPEIINECLQQLPLTSVRSLDEILHADAQARSAAKRLIEGVLRA